MKRTSQKDIAKRLGMTEKVLSDIVRGRVTPTYRLAKALATATRTDLLLWFEGDMAAKKAAIHKA